MAEKKNFDELEAMLADPDVPDAAIRPYLRVVPEETRPFVPVVQPDPDRVVLRPLDEVRARGFGFLDWANRWSRRRRYARFMRHFEADDPAPVLVSEGDSWFQFPLFLDDTIDLLAPHYLIFSLDAAGDTLINMTGPGREYLEPLFDPKVGPRVRGLLFSAGGNDIIGVEPSPDGDVPVLAKLLIRRRPDLAPAAHIREDELEKRLAAIETGYRRVLEEVAKHRPGVFVVGHGYAYAIPAFPGDPRNPRWTKHGGWLRDPLAALGFSEPSEQRAIVRVLIDRLYERLARLMGGNCPGGAYPHGWLVDCRDILAEVNDWADEIHPTDAPERGFARVAARFHEVIRNALAAVESRTTERPHRAGATERPARVRQNANSVNRGSTERPHSSS
ncbi:MAG: hypothetical protein RMK73_15070 [Geminicoccaceae bacterium]|nr:hypothetical protein [Geminicoccaceae bacterium]